jgi:hypothetical protein
MASTMSGFADWRSTANKDWASLIRAVYTKSDVRTAFALDLRCLFADCV